MPGDLVGSKNPFATHQQRKAVASTLADKLFSITVKDQPSEPAQKPTHEQKEKLKEEKSEKRKAFIQKAKDFIALLPQGFSLDTKCSSPSLERYKRRASETSSSLSHPLRHIPSADDPISNAILVLNLLADFDKDIQSRYESITISTENESIEVDVLYRDARKQKRLSPRKYLHANWTIIGLNYINAAITLLELHNIPKKEWARPLAQLANQHIDLASDTGKKHPESLLEKMIHVELVPLVQQLLNSSNTSTGEKTAFSPQDVKNMLTEAREFNNFKCPTFVVATHSTIDVVEEKKTLDRDCVYHLDIDVPMCGNLTPLQKDQYDRLQEVGVKDNELKDIPWYTAQNKRVRALIKKHAKDVVNGRMISTLLRKYLSGVRNAGHEFIYVKRASCGETEKPECIFETYHSGNPSHQFPDTATHRDTNVSPNDESIRQMGQLVNPSQPNDVIQQHVIQLDLTTDLPNQEGGKKGMNAGTRTAIANNNSLSSQNIPQHETKTDKNGGGSTTTFHYANLTAHRYRSFLSNVYDGVDFIRKAAQDVEDTIQRLTSDDSTTSAAAASSAKPIPSEDFLKKAEETLAKTFHKGEHSSEDKHRSQADENRKRLQQLIKEYDVIKNSIQWSLFDEENLNLRLACISAALAYYINQLCGANYLVQNAFCKSGKDRTGVLRAMINAYATYLYITNGDVNQANQKQMEAIEASLACSDQIGVQAGYAGNSLGTYGILNSAKYAQPASQSAERAKCKTADQNKEVPSATQLPFYKNKKFWLGIGSVLITAALGVTGIGAIFALPIIVIASSTTTLGVGSLLAANSFWLRKDASKKEKPFYKTGRFWAIFMGSALGLVLCGTGIGALAGIPLLAIAAAGVGGVLTATLGSALGVAGITMAALAARSKKPAFMLFSLGMAAVGVALCLTGFGAFGGIPLIATSIVNMVASAGTTVMAGATFLSTVKSKDPTTPWYKKATFWLSLGAVLIGAALCATGMGAFIGMPMILTTISTTTLSIGGCLAVTGTATAIGLKPSTGRIKIVGCVLLGVVGIAAGVGLCLTGFGLIGGIPLMASAIAFLSTIAKTVLSATTLGASGTVIPAAAGAAFTVGGSGAAYHTTKKIIKLVESHSAYNKTAIKTNELEIKAPPLSLTVPSTPTPSHGGESYGGSSPSRVPESPPPSPLGSPRS